jgi:1,4-dihydroxy-2-naphthoate octaprenyltransferase
MRRWILAARPPTLWAAVAPVLVGAATAVADDVFRIGPFGAVLAAALAIQIGVNFANDVADAATGADTEARIGPSRAVASGMITPAEMWRAIAVVFGAAGLIGVYLIAEGGPVILFIGIASMVAALGYTNGPVPYGYRGLGELFVFVFFGLVATVGTRWVFDRSAPVEAWVGGVVMGLLATAILVANNVRDVDTDRDAGKRTLVVVLGRTFGRWLYAATTVGAVVIVVVAAAVGALPLAALLAAPALVPAVLLSRVVFTRVAGPPLIAVLVGTGRLQIGVAALLATGIVIG